MQAWSNNTHAFDFMSSLCFDSDGSRDNTCFQTHESCYTQSPLEMLLVENSQRLNWLHFSSRDNKPQEGHSPHKFDGSWVFQQSYSGIDKMPMLPLNLCLSAGGIWAGETMIYSEIRTSVMLMTIS